MSFSPAQAVANARADVGYHEGRSNYNKFSLWQYGNPYNPWCDSAVCKWSYDAGYRFPSYSACGDRGDYNVTSHRIHSQRDGTWRDRNHRASPGDLVPLAFTEPDQHIEMVIADNGGPTIATIGGNTSDAVLFRTRYRQNVVGFICTSLSSQVGTTTPPVTTKELLAMGMTPGKVVPGSRRQTKDPWKGRFPFVAAINNSDGTTDLCGFNGAVISGAKAAFGLSIYHLGHLKKPIRSVDALVDKRGNWAGLFTGLAEDGGDFTVRVHVEYL